VPKIEPLGTDVEIAESDIVLNTLSSIASQDELSQN
jgi:hypothetical protein